MRKILILSPGPFSKKDYDRFGIALLKKNFVVKILDFTAWIYPDFWKECLNTVYKCEEYKVIRNKNDFLEFNTEKDPIIVLDFLGKNKKTNWVRDELKKRNSFFVGFDINLIPRDKIKITKSLKKLISLIFLPKKFLYFFFNFFEQRYYNISKHYLPQILVVGGLSSSRQSKVKHKIYTHCFDYDIYLNLRNKPTNNAKKPYAVFLDEDMVTHPDHIFHNVSSPVSEFQYYSVLIKFLKKFEIETGLQIKFAVHPKSRNMNLPNLLKDIACVKGNTAELVKDSKAVLLHSSTSLSYAILFEKPAIFLTSNELKKSWIGDRIVNFSRAAGGKIINMDVDTKNNLILKDLIKFDKNKYQEYKDKYLKYPNSPDVPLWKIFSENINNICNIDSNKKILTKKRNLGTIFFIQILKKILGLKFYSFMKHVFRYYGFFSSNYNINNEIDFGTIKADNIFKHELKKSKIYLEYGSGSSTLLAQKLNKDYFSVEGDKDFYKYIKKKIKSDRIIFKSLGFVKDYSIPINLNYEYNSKKISNEHKIRIKNYCNGILNYLDEKKIIPDLILVDGRYRNLCGLYLYNFFKNKNVQFKIIFDDYIDRKHHHILEKFFDIKKFERFGIATNLKNNLDTDDIIKKSYYDCR